MATQQSVQYHILRTWTCLPVYTVYLYAASSLLNIILFGFYIRIVYLIHAPNVSLGCTICGGGGGKTALHFSPPPVFPLASLLEFLLLQKAETFI